MSTHKRLSLIASLSLAVGLALGVGACGGSSGTVEPPEDAVAYQIEVEQAFEGYEPRGWLDLGTYEDKAMEIGRKRKDAVPDDAEEADLAAASNKSFAKANKAYREGDYAKAQEGYEAVLDKDPLHYGANVNLTLALLQQGQDADALTQSLVCVYLYPKESAPLLNVQAAGVACGFPTDHLETAMNDVAKEGQGYGSRASLSGDYDDFYAYNKLWERIETELYPAAQTTAAGDAAAPDDSAQEDDARAAEEAADASDQDAVASEEAADGSAQEASDEADGANSGMDDDATTEADDATEGTGANARATYAEGAAAYTQLGEELDELGGRSSDSDVDALRAYLYAVGLQLGYEVDLSKAQSAHTTPFIVADDDLCKIEVTELVQDDDGCRLELSVANKTDDMRLDLSTSPTWTVNGEELAPELPAYVAQPDATTELTLYLSEDASAIAEDVTSLTGLVVVRDVSGKGAYACYPVAWEAAEATVD